MTDRNPGNGKLLETHMDQLQRQLADAGVSISGMSVNSQGAQGQSANTSQNQSCNGLQHDQLLPVFQQESEDCSPVSCPGLHHPVWITGYKRGKNDKSRR